MKRFFSVSIIVFMFLLVSLSGFAAEGINEGIQVDSCNIVTPTSFSSVLLPQDIQKDSVQLPVKKKGFLPALGRVVDGLINWFTSDTAWVEPCHYFCWAQLQSQLTYDLMTPHFHKANDFELINRAVIGTRPTIMAGFNVGISLLSYSLMFQIGRYKNQHGDTRSNTELQLQTSRFVIDLFRMETGNQFKLYDVKLNRPDLFINAEGQYINFISNKLEGFDFYYIFNWKHFSSPAAYSMSTVQKRSAGTWMGGFGYNSSSTSFNVSEYLKFSAQNIIPGKEQEVADLIEGYTNISMISPEMLTYLLPDISYKSYYLMGGYAYNWVPAPRWLVGGLAMMELSYKRHLSENYYYRYTGHYFIPDAMFRLAAIYNTGDWYAGMESQAFSNFYHDRRYCSINMHARVRFFVGFYFLKNKAYKKKKLVL